MEHFLFFIFTFGLLGSSFFVAFLTNPINAVFFLVLSFCNATGLLLLLEAEFLALLFLVVYVGAIAVLFLFVIIILNLKETFKFNNTTGFVVSFKNIFFFIFFSFVFGIQLSFVFKKDFHFFDNYLTFTIPDYIEWVAFFDFFHNIVLFGQLIYTFYFFYFLLAGFILLVAIVGAVVLTSQKKANSLSKKNQRQFVFNQLARSKKNAVFLLKRSVLLIKKMRKKNVYIKLSTILQKKGKKQLSLRIVQLCFHYIKKNFKINPLFVFNKAIDNVMPPFELMKMKKGTQTVFVVKLAPKQKRSGLALRWLVGACNAIKQRFPEKLAIELCTAATRKGKAFDKKIDLLKKAETHKTSLFTIVRIQQLLKIKRKKITAGKKNIIKGNPQIKGICVKVFTISPRKPNSAVRKVCRVKLSNKSVITAYIRGEGHNLQEHSTVLINGGKTKDLPGLRYKVIRGVYDSSGVINRKTSRSKYGAKKGKLAFFENVA